MTTGIELVRPPTLSATAPYAYAAVTDARLAEVEDVLGAPPVRAD